MRVYRSPALTLIFNEIKSAKKNHILDLGTMTSSGMRFFSQLRCKVQVEDLSNYISDAIDNQTRESIINLDGNLLNYNQEDKFDAVLLWDILNYLDLNSIQIIMQQLSKFIKHDCLLHSIRYVEKKIPKKPQCFHIKDQYFIEVEDSFLEERRVEPFSTAQFSKNFPSYKTQKTIMNKEGMAPGIIENLLRYQPENHEFTGKPAKIEADNDLFSLAKSRIIHKSPALVLINQHLKSNRKINILNLGPNIDRNTDYFIERSESFYNADLYPYLQWQKNLNTNKNLQTTSLKIPRNKLFDIILMWDIFNFSSYEQTLIIAKLLSEITHKDSLIVAFLYSNYSHIEKPQKFSIIDKETLHLTKNTALNLPKINTCYSHLQRGLKDFGLTSTFSYREGMAQGISEYIMQISNWNKKAFEKYR